MQTRCAELLVLICVVLAASFPVLSQSTPALIVHGAPHDAQTDAAFDHFYNMEYERSTEEFEKIVDKHPNDPFALNHLLTVVLMRDLYDTGAMNTGDYTNDSFIGRTPRPTDTKVKDRIKELVRRAEAVEEQELKVQSARRQRTLLPRRHPSAILGLYRTDRAGMVLRAA